MKSSIGEMGLKSVLFCSFLNDPSYKEIIENSSTFNSRLCAERRMRMPFIDTQTGKTYVIIDFPDLSR